MRTQYQDLIKTAYSAFNSRDSNTVLSTFHKDVHWSNGWEGGYVNGHGQIKEYWMRQWKEIDAHVEPTAFKEEKMEN